MSTHVELGSSKEKLIKGVDTLANAVKVTLGAAGKTVIIEHLHRSPEITKDGVTVAKSIILDDPIENMGAQVVKEAASKTADNAGDGTTTSTVLAQKLIQDASKLDDSYILSEVKLGMEQACGEVLSFLEDNAIPVDASLLFNVASISANNDEALGAVIAEAFVAAGKDGVVDYETSKTGATYIKKSEGLELQRGYDPVHYFINNKDKEKCIFDDALILMCDVKIQTIHQIGHMLEFAIQNNKPLLVIAEMTDEVLNTLTVNKIKGNMQVCVIKPPMFGIKRKEIMEDIANVTGAIVISDETGDNFQNVTFDFFGGAKKVTVGKNNTTIVAQNVDDGAVKDKIKSLERKIKNSKSDEETDWLKERIAKLSNGVSVIHVGAKSEIEQKEKNARVDDAVHATKAAIEEGIVAGGGIALFDASFKLNATSKNKNINAGYGLVVNAMRTPLYQIVANAGSDEKAEDVVNRVTLDSKQEKWWGYNVKTGKFGNMLEMGIVDPLKVTKSALVNAVSVASTIMSTECTVTTIRQ